MQENSHDFFSVSDVVFVFVSPEGSLSRHCFVLQGRGMRAIYPCGTGCVGKRLNESEYGNKSTQEKKRILYASIAPLSSQWLNGFVFFLGGL